MDARKLGKYTGQRLHDMGQCRPCSNMKYGRSSCHRSEDCGFCHLDHSDDIKPAMSRPCRGTRRRCKQLIEKLKAKYKDDPEEEQRELQRLVGKFPYAASLLKETSKRGEEDKLGAIHVSQFQSAVPDIETMMIIQRKKRNCRGKCANSYMFPVF
eukprot:TRINITY_DN38858_c0_g1_i1.p1 TRINITY_DN38858_c0_g1~~TRINITY_DN38858_c0_g1_i1.p1  ORF type:complete len:155 (+),score=15.24 TRINITY_DN38858_c0_g1_i1:455-919(+)